MEKLVYVALVALGVGLVAVGCGLWLGHSAINDGDVWKGVVACIVTGVGGYVSAAVVGALVFNR